MSEILDGMGLPESRMNEMSAKADRFNEMARHLETMHILELMTRVEALGDKATRASIFERWSVRWALLLEWRNASRA